MLYIGYDIGSSSVKAALVDGNTKKTLGIVQYPEREMPIISHQAGWAEQRPEDWWDHVIKATDKLFAQTNANRGDVKAIGIAYQMHGLVAIDQEGIPVRPSIIWCDSRAIEIGQQAFKAIGEDRCLNELLNSPGNFTASKLKWVQENEPELYAKIHKVMLPGDYIAYQFTGRAVTTPSGLSEGIFWDFKADQLSSTVMDHYGFDPDLIPTIKPTFSDQGTITSAIAQQFGFSKQAIVSYRAGDQPNNAFSLNVLEPGEIAATAGTSGVVYGVTDQKRFDPQNRVNTFAHLNHTPKQARLGILLCVNGTGSAYSWLRNQLAADKSYFDLEKIATPVPIGAQGLTFLPFGNGAERMLGNRLIGAHFGNLQFNRHDFSHMVRACLEGIAFSIVYGIRCMQDLGVDPGVMKVGNDNLFQSSIFSQTIATLTGTEIQLKETSGAVGAAIGAGFGASGFSSLKEAFSAETIHATHRANPSNQAALEAAYQTWKACLAQQG